MHSTEATELDCLSKYFTKCWINIWKRNGTFFVNAPRVYRDKRVLSQP